MKSSHRLWDLRYSVSEFLKANKIKLILLLVVFIAACAFGIGSGCGVDAAVVLEGRKNYSLLVGAETRSVVGYLFFNLLVFALCFAVILLTSFSVYLCVVSAMIFFYTSYIMGYTAAVFIVYFKLAALPFIMICYIPFALIVGFAIGCAVILAIDCGREFRRCGISVDIFKGYLPKFALGGALLVVGVVYGCLLGGVFTSGLIV